MTIYDFYRDARDNLWIGTNNGLYIQYHGSNLFTLRRLIYKGSALTVSKIFPGQDGTYSKVSFAAKDNGVGFDIIKMKALAAKSMSGKGLINMERRAAEMNGQCLIESTPGEGQ